MYEKGFVLLFTLVLMQLMTSISLCSLFAVHLIYKANRHAWEQVRAVKQALSILQELEINLLYHAPNCLVSGLSPREMIKKPDSWWLEQGCSGNQMGMRYYYVTELLANDACAQLKTAAGNQAGEYYRMTVYYLFNQERGVKAFLQSVVVKPVPSSSACTDKVHLVNAGRQMSRGLNLSLF